MKVVVGIYLVFVIITIYLYSLFLLLFFNNRKDLFNDRISNNLRKVTICIPAYNEEKTVGDTIKAVLNSNYPKKLLEVIVVDDGSTDKTAEIAKRFPVKVLTKKNEGTKASAVNYGLKYAKGELFAVVDADSYPDSDSLIKVVSCFDDEEIGAATSSVRVYNKEKLLGKLQNIEYTLIAWVRKLLEYINSVYVTPGPLSMYRTNLIKQIGGFDSNILTEDIELAWGVLRKNWKIKMCLSAKVFTVVPTTIKGWWRQRLRWDIGGIQTVLKHKEVLGSKKYGMLGLFVSPFFMSTFILSLVGFGVWCYVIGTKLLSYFSRWFFSFETNSLFMQVKSFYLTPSVFMMFGFMLISVYLIYLGYALKTLDKVKVTQGRKMTILIYLFIYLMFYPIVFLQSIYKLIVGKYQW